MQPNDSPIEPLLPVTSDTPATDDGAAPAAPKRRSRRPAAEAAAQEMVESSSAESLQTEIAAEASAEASDDAAGGAADGEPGRRGRNRRRGRGRGREGVDAAGESGAPHPQGERLPREPAAPLPDPAEAIERFAEVLSGAYDAEPPEPDDAATLEQASKRVLRPEPEAPKLHKVLAQSGIGSRRDMEQLIQDGAVTVNDEVAHIGMRIAQGDRVAVNGKMVRIRIHGTPARLLAYHKPAGEVVTFNDPEGRPTVFRRLPRIENGKWQSVGRLDINTEGLLLFTTSGELANQLMHPRFGVEREYAVRVLGSLDEAQRARLIEGVEIDGQPANFKSIEDGGGEGANRWVRVVITEGRNREVRKLFDKVGLAVSRLIRIRYGNVVLPRGLKRGVWVELGDAELRAIRQVLHGSRSEAREPPPPRAERRNGRAPKPQAGGGRPAVPPMQPPRERPPRREPRSVEPGPDGEDFGAIPNPLEQTFDRRFAKGPRRGGTQGFGHAKPELEHGPAGTIPNPLEQTFDKRFVKGSQRINAGFGRPDGDPHGAPAAGKKGGPKQPDPMQTSVGYIGADAYFNKVGGKRGGGGGGGGGRRGR